MSEVQTMSFIVGETRGKLLSFLREKVPSYPSVKSLKKAIEERSCRVNGQIVTFSTHEIVKGDRIVFAMSNSKEPLSIHLLYEDESLLICNKPSGVVCEDGIFQKYLPRGYQKNLLVHRLDKDTSGLILLAKSLKVKEDMIALFREHQVEKKYLALVCGSVKQTSGKKESLIGKRFSKNGQTSYGSMKEGKHALTLWERLSLSESASLLLCQPITGRTHQIRVHLSEMGHSIIGDMQYARAQSSKFFSKRHLLHAYQLSFVHPYSKESLNIHVNPPKDFMTLLNQLKLSFPFDEKNT